MHSLLRLLTVLAVLISPLAMVAPATAAGAASHHAAMTAADHGAAASEHCAPPADEDGKNRTGGSPDCAIACAALPGHPSALADPPAPPPLAIRIASSQLPAGLRPESETPPPRTTPET